MKTLRYLVMFMFRTENITNRKPSTEQQGSHHIPPCSLYNNLVFMFQTNLDIVIELLLFPCCA